MSSSDFVSYTSSLPYNNNIIINGNASSSVGTTYLVILILLLTLITTSTVNGGCGALMASAFRLSPPPPSQSASSSSSSSLGRNVDSPFDSKTSMIGNTKLLDVGQVLRTKLVNAKNAAFVSATNVWKKQQKRIMLWDEDNGNVDDGDGGDMASPFAVKEEEEMMAKEGIVTRTALGNSKKEQEKHNHDDEYSDDDEDESYSGREVTHFCFIVHGHRGLSKDLSYLQTVMKEKAKRERRQGGRKQQQSMTVPTAALDKANDTILSDDEAGDDGHDNKNGVVQSSSSSTTTPATAASTELRHRIIVHSAVCNENRTGDGVENGGQRLAEEMLSVIRKEMVRRQKKMTKEKEGEGGGEEVELRDVTISLVGNSLGGIYARYAIAKLAEEGHVVKRKKKNVVNQKDGGTRTTEEGQNGEEEEEDDDEKEEGWIILDGRYRVHYNIFCTTASPHLGVSQHTYLPIPRTAEIGVAHALGDTGRDLFRLNDLMKTMATSPRFLDPLGSFRKRIAYANAYRTDFPVPTQTAAFVCFNSRYPHHFIDDDNDNDDNDFGGAGGDDDSGGERMTIEAENGLIIATFHTPPSSRRQKNQSVNENRSEMDLIEEEQVDELVHMSTSLDSLGWKKVFVDVRGEIPLGLPIPQLIKSNLTPKSDENSGGVGNGGGGGDEEEEKDKCPVRNLRRKRVVESRDLATVFSMPSDNWLSLPIGHNMICAFSRSRISALINKGGRPVMDALAREMVDEILAWNMPEQDT